MTVKEVPPKFIQLNLFLDEEGIVRVKSKFGRFANKKYCSVLLPKNNLKTKVIVKHFHEKQSHAGIYTGLNEIRKKFYIPSIYSVVKRTVRKCFQCKKFNNQTVQNNQSSYREFRVEAENVLLRTVFIDYIGPFYVEMNGTKSKIYLLCFSCLWSRAMNLVNCKDLSVEMFVRGFQMHCYSYGVPSLCYSDIGSQIVAGSRLISDFTSDMKTAQYIRGKGLDTLTFKQFPKGKKELGGIVESAVRAVKRLIYSSIKKYILCMDNFDLLIPELLIIIPVINTINKRPIALQASLRSSDTNEPFVITPELMC